GLSVVASEYDHLTGTTAYAVSATRWLGNILGANAWGSSFIVGDGSTFPDCMQHQVANLGGSLNGSPPVLAGAVVEGPNSLVAKGLVSGMRTCPPDGVDRFDPFNSRKAVYQDNVQSWATVEPAIDLGRRPPWRSRGRSPGRRPDGLDRMRSGRLDPRKGLEMGEQVGPQRSAGRRIGVAAA